PLHTLGACLLFGAADSLQIRLQSEAIVPHTVWATLAIVGIVILFLALTKRRRSALSVIVALVMVCVGAALFLTRPAVGLPSQLWRTIPYVLSLAVLAGAAGQALMPTALAQAYDRRNA